MADNAFEKRLKDMEEDKFFAQWCKDRGIDPLSGRDFGGDEGYTLLDVYDAFVAGRILERTFSIMEEGDGSLTIQKMEGEYGHLRSFKGTGLSKGGG